MDHSLRCRVSRTTARARFAVLLVVLAQLWGGHLHLSLTHTASSPSTDVHHQHDVQIHVQTSLGLDQADLNTEEGQAVDETDIASPGVVKKPSTNSHVLVFLLVPLLILLVFVSEQRLFSRQFAQIIPTIVLPHLRPLSHAPPR